jgi:protein gp37
MGDQSSIEWTDATVNFWRGCDKVSPGCAHCYMFDGQRRYGRDPSVVVRASRPVFNAPLSPKWRRRARAIAEAEGRRMRVFTCSWSDFFHEDADPWRDDAWDIIRSCPEYDWQVLTKRPELVADRLPADWGEGWPHVWLGVSIENRRFVHRADLLRETPAAVRFISAEPLLGPLVYDCEVPEHDEWGRVREWVPTWSDDHADRPLDLHDISWLIVGGESGPRHRRFDLQWARDLRDACADSGTAYFLKQLGGAWPGDRLEDLPPDLRIRSFPRPALEAVRP